MHTWTVRIASAAKADYRDILIWTSEKFGARQADVYAKALSSAITALGAGPKTVGAKPRNDIRKGLFTLHLARDGRKGRHFLVFKVDDRKGAQVIEILRVLHGAMDLQRHVPAANDIEFGNQS